MSFGSRPGVGSVNRIKNTKIKTQVQKSEQRWLERQVKKNDKKK